MTRILQLAFVLGAFISVTLPATGKGDCPESLRKFDLGNSKIINLRNFQCQSEAGAPIDIEFYRLSETATNFVIRKIKSNLLSKVVGEDPKVIHNDVYEKRGFNYPTHN
jgi:hypothetical protein